MFKEKVNRKKQQQINYFFSEELLLVYFFNLHVGQHNLFSQFTTKESTTERRTIVVASELHF